MFGKKIESSCSFWRPFVVAAFCGIWSGMQVSPANAQLIVGNDATSGQLYVIDLMFPANTRSLVGTPTTDFQVDGLAADNTNGILYWIDSGSRFLRAPIVSSGTLSQTFIANLTVGGTTTSFVSLAYDSTDNVLVAYRNSASATTEGFYSVDTTTGVCTLLALAAATSDNYAGLDYDPVTDAFYGTNENSTLANRGLYRVNKPWTAPTFTFLDEYPDADTNVDGTAVGAGRAYLVNDAAAQGAFPYNITTGSFETTISPLPYTATGTDSGGAWAPGMIPLPPGAEVSITKTDSPDPMIVPVGGNPTDITYTITVTNNGPDSATDVMVTDTLPGNVTFVSVDPPGMHDSGVISANIGGMTNGQVVAFNVVVTPTGLGTVSNTATVSSTSPDAIIENNSSTATTTVREPEADISASITAPPSCSLLPGGTANYTFTLANAGPESAENAQLVVTFPANVTFMSSTPPVVPVGNTLTLSLGTVAAASNGTLMADFLIDSGSSVVMNASVSTTTGDPNAANNTASNTMNMLVLPATSPIKGIFSTIASSPTSDVPGQPGLHFATTAGIERPYRSPDGTKWIMMADTDNSDAVLDQFILVGTVGGSFDTVAREGVTILPNGQTIGTSPRDQLSINDAGQWVFTTNANGASTTDDEMVVKWDGAQLVTVAQEGSLCPAFPPENDIRYGATAHSPSIQNDGSVSFYFTLVNTPANQENTYLTDDGATILAQEGVTVPTNQGNATTYAYDTFPSGTIGVGLSLNAAGTSFCGMIDLITAPTAEDRTLVVDNDVKIQEGFVVPGSGFGSIVASASPLMNFMESNGDWFSYGSNADGQDWVVRNGLVIAATGTEVVNESGLFWGDASFAQTFFSAVGSPNGNYVIGGVFNGPAVSNAALVMNGTTIVARENDPVDLDNNGLFDDGTYIRTFSNNKLFMSNSVIYTVVTLRGENAALCGATDTEIGQALISIPIGGTALPCCKGDMDGSAHVDQDDVGEFITQLVLDVGGDPCPLATADVNNDTVVDGLDVSSFVDRVLANGGTGTACP